MSRRSLASLMLAAILSLYCGSTALAQEKPFEGITIVVVNNAGGNSEYVESIAGGWEEETGGTVEMNPIPFGDIKDRVLTAVTTDTFIGDVLIVPPGVSGDLMGGGYVIEVPEESIEAADFDDLLPIYLEQNLGWGGRYYAWPWDGDLHTLNYRADIIENAEHQAAFEAEYGYPLAVPKTWQEYADIGKFMTEHNPEGVVYGWAEVAGRRNGSFHGFCDRAVSYAKHPDDPAFYFDAETMDARINNPGFVRALEDWVAAIPYAPPDVTSYGFFETEQAFATGMAGFCINWTDVGVYVNDPEGSAVVGKVSYAELPGSYEVWNSITGEWETFDEPNQPGYAAFGGWSIMIPENANHIDAAVSFANYLASPEVMTVASQTPLSGVNPARISTLEDIQGWIERAGFPSEENAKAYTDSIINSLYNPNVVFQLRIPGYSQYEDALELAVSEALTGQRSAQESLDAAAQTWNEITDRLGREEQLGNYRALLGLPPLE